MNASLVSMETGDLSTSREPFHCVLICSPDESRVRGSNARQCMRLGCACTVQLISNMHERLISHPQIAAGVCRTTGRGNSPLELAHATKLMFISLPYPVLVKGLANRRHHKAVRTPTCRDEGNVIAAESDGAKRTEELTGRRGRHTRPRG